MSSHEKEIARQATQLIRDIFAGSAEFIQTVEPVEGTFGLITLLSEVYAIQRTAALLGDFPVTRFSGVERAHCRDYLRSCSELASLRTVGAIRPEWKGWWEHSKVLYNQMAGELDINPIP